ncbi:DUF1134 domain-containing protein [Parvibaculum sp.]|uniref:DUF1134 domain-containing protein n=1 Tax=Parvibaculum sp. TaxID=2024848 RepID=UPI002CD6FA6D|nr:DUF1134 domain-containing protein [Parvibaculum sp.]HUD49964.1 DUF1134 domain-containing protein [Parvibaculum sp.]
MTDAAHGLRTALATGIALFLSMTAPALAAETNQEAPAVRSHSNDTYSEQEIVREAGSVFGSTAQGMADAVHSVFQKYGEPNGYIKGEEASGAIVVGLRYGSGTLVKKNGGTAKVFWQGPSAGWDFGGNAVKVFTLVYNLPDAQTIYQRFPGVEGSAYLIGGIGVNYQQRGNVILAPMRSGVGLRLGASVGYLKYTKSREWLPF